MGLNIQSSTATGHSMLKTVTIPFTNRSFRVIVLIALIAAMSMVDLYLTILYITHTGMNELNPLARGMMEYQSPAILGLWKVATVVLGVGILAWIRTKRSAELGAWTGCLILGFLMTHWVAYIHEDARLSNGPIQIEAMGNTNWVIFESDALSNFIGPGSATPQATPQATP